MSRTYRKRQDQYWLTEEEYLADKSWQRWMNNKPYKALVARYYSDSQEGMWQVPKWYKVQYCRRPFRRKEKVALIKEMQRDFDGEVPFPVIKKDALYYW